MLGLARHHGNINQIKSRHVLQYSLPVVLVIIICSEYLSLNEEMLNFCLFLRKVLKREFVVFLKLLYL